jgi:hypothetical protein
VVVSQAVEEEGSRPTRILGRASRGSNERELEGQNRKKRHEGRQTERTKRMGLTRHIILLFQ